LSISSQGLSVPVLLTSSQFIKADAWMYGKKESVEYLCPDLLWGIKLYRKLRFVLVKSARGNSDVPLV